MGLEKKVGVGVVVGLLVIFGIVLTLRLTTTKDKPLTALGQEAATKQATTVVATTPRSHEKSAAQPVLLPANDSRKTPAWETSRRTVISDSQVQPTSQLLPVSAPSSLMMPQLASAEKEMDTGKVAQSVAPAPRPLLAASGATSISTLPARPAETRSSSMAPAVPNPSPMPIGSATVQPVPERRVDMSTTPQSSTSVKNGKVGTEGDPNPLRGAMGSRAGGSEPPSLPPKPETMTGRTAETGPGRYGDVSVGRSADPGSNRTNDGGVGRFGNPGVAGPSEVPVPTYRQASRYGYPPADNSSASSPPMSNPGLGSSAVGPSYAPPVPTPRVNPENLRRPDGSYKVQPNDTYWSISEKMFGSGAYFRALAEHNREKNPREDRLQAGVVISVPTAPELEKSYPDMCPKPNHRRPAGANIRPTGLSMVSQSPDRRTYVVVEGDTLSDIAKFELGKRSRWGEIYQLNRDRLGDNYDYLVPGTELLLPASEPANVHLNDTNLTNRPGSTYKR